MAIRDKEGKWRGKAGNWVFRCWRNLNIIQGMPRKVAQTPRSKAAAAEFGLASSTAGAIRKLFPVLYQHPDAGMAPRLVSTVLRSIRQAPDKEVLERDLHDGDLSVLKNFQFNIHSPLDGCLPNVPELQILTGGALRIHIPQLSYESVKCPIPASKRSFFKIRLMAIAFNFREGYYDLLDWKDWHIYREQSLESQDWEIVGKAPEGSVLMIAMAVYAGMSHSAEDILLNQEAWSPAAILDACHIHSSLDNTIGMGEEYPKEIPKQHSPLSINIDWHRMRMLRIELLPSLRIPRTPRKDNGTTEEQLLLQRGRGSLNTY